MSISYEGPALEGLLSRSKARGRRLRRRRRRLAELTMLIAMSAVGTIAWGGQSLGSTVTGHRVVSAAPAPARGPAATSAR